MKKIMLLVGILVLGFLTACTTNEVSVSFETGDGTSIEDVIFELESSFTLPSNPELEGHEFTGWYYDELFEEKFSLKDTLEEDVTLYAKYEKLEYKVRIKNQDDELIHLGEYEYEYDLSLLDFGELYTDLALTSKVTDFVLMGDSEFYILEEQVFMIGSNIYYYHDNFMDGVIRPAIEAAAFNMEVELLMVDSEGDQARLNMQVDEFIEMGVSVLLINLVDPGAAGKIIEKAAAADIPLVFFMKEPYEDNIMESYDKVWYVGVDPAGAGITQGEMIARHWLANSDWDLNADGVIDYVLLKGEPGHPDAEARTMESVKALTDAGISVNELAIQFSPVWSTADAYNTMETWLSGTFADDIELVICNNDGMAFGAIQAMQNAGKDIPVYGIDALMEALNMIGDGRMNGTVMYDGEGIAETAVLMAINAGLGKDVMTDVPYELETDGTKAVRIPFIPVDETNLEDHN